MSAAREEAWFVILTDGPPRSPAAAADLAARANTRITRFDALRAFRSDSGLIPSPLPPEEARMLATALSAGGVGALAIPGARLQFPAQARALSWAALTDEGLSVRLGWTAAPSTVPWTFFHAWRLARVLPTGGTRDLVRLRSHAARRAATAPAPSAPAGKLVTRDELLALGLAAATEALTWWVDVPFAEAWAVARGLSHVKSGDPEANLEPQAPPARPQEPELWLDLCGLDPPLRLRIRQATFDYELLGGARGLSSRANFAALVRLFSPHLAHAEASGQIEDALEGRLHARRDDDAAELEREHDLSLLGVLTRIALRGGT